MKSKIVYISTIILLQAFLACNNTDEALCILEDQKVSYLEETMDSSICHSYDSLSTLSFGSYSEYQNVTCQLRNLGSNDERKQWMRDSYPGFVSIHDIYEQAGEEASTTDLVTEEQFNSFRCKYSCLYFPMVEEDAGFYIPIKDDAIAFLANRDCKIIIGNEEITVKDIHNYFDLQLTGRAFYELPSAMSVASEIPFEITGYDMKSVGPEYDSGWTEYKKEGTYHVKVKLKARRLLKKFELSYATYGSKSFFHTEFCFRKKSPFGWLNYKDSSAISGEVLIPLFGTLILGSSENGMSSHDKEYLYPIHISSDANFKYYRYYEASCKTSVSFKDMSLNYSWTMQGLVCKRAANTNVFPIIPSNQPN